MSASRIEPTGEGVSDLVRWLRVLRAGGGSTAPAISLAPRRNREFSRPGSDRSGDFDICVRTRDAIDRHLVVERLRSVGIGSDPGTPATPAPGALHPTERQAVFGLLRQRLEEIMASVSAPDDADGHGATGRADTARPRA